MIFLNSVEFFKPLETFKNFKRAIKVKMQAWEKIVYFLRLQIQARE